MNINKCLKLVETLRRLAEENPTAGFGSYLHHRNKWDTRLSPLWAATQCAEFVRMGVSENHHGGMNYNGWTGFIAFAAFFQLSCTEAKALLYEAPRDSLDAFVSRVEARAAELAA